MLEEESWRTDTTRNDPMTRTSEYERSSKHLGLGHFIDAFLVNRVPLINKNLELEFVEDEVSSEEVTINYVVVSDRTFILETRWILNISPSLSLETVEWDFWVEFLVVLEDTTRSTETDKLVI